MESLDRVLVTVGGIGLVGLIYWFFFGKKEVLVEAGKKIDILVDGGYKPAGIKVKVGVKTTLSLLRKDTNSCLEEFILPDFRIKKYLPLGRRVEVEITPTRKGEYGFHCGMNMYHGKIIAE